MQGNPKSCRKKSEPKKMGRIYEGWGGELNEPLLKKKRKQREIIGSVQETLNEENVMEGVWGFCREIDFD